MLLGSAFFSGAEAGLFTLDSIQSRRLRGEKGISSRWARALLQKPSELLTTLLVGNTIVNVAFSVVGTAFFIKLLGKRSGVEWSIVVLSFLVLVFGEVSPKTIAVNFPLRASRLSAIPLRIAAIILNPLTAVFLGTSRGLLRLLGIHGELRHNEKAAGPKEVREVFREVESGEEITDQESRLVQNILGFSGTAAEEVMTPRIDMICAPDDMERGQLTEWVRKSRHSRIPIYHEDVDHILGFLHVKEFLLYPDRPLERLLRPVSFYPETTQINRIFREIQRSRKGMVIVVNEFGETMGLITREDLIEEIVGEIYDEYEKADPDIVEESEGVYLIRGGAGLEDINETLGLDLPINESVTLNGFLCELEGGIPHQRSCIKYESMIFHILEVRRHRVQKVRLVIPGTGEVAVQDEEGSS
ncbi:MAG: hemolysin family protein [Candidatus Eisenbacteria bacterium]|uniref:Hemolysin family protein n=1 Tax=Eiseniibacteriota bacterium TaxID=2212470 RepID=A0A948RTA6_UNCEI|nr:hemolysin family protein [Candidatus Eisenbacteria bacterium]